MTNQVKAYRTRKELTQAALAKLIGTSQQCVQKVEANVSRPSREMAIRFCRALNATPCAVFPDLAALCSEPSLLRTCDSRDLSDAASLPVDWQVRIEGADQMGRLYWTNEQEARRIQEFVGRYNAATAAAQAKFLVFGTPSKAVAVNLCLVDWIRVAHTPDCVSQRQWERVNQETLQVLLKEGTQYREVFLNLTDAEGAALPTNFDRLMQTGRLPLLITIMGTNGVNVLNTERMVLIEMPLTHLLAEETAASSDSQSTT